MRGRRRHAVRLPRRPRRLRRRPGRGAGPGDGAGAAVRGPARQPRRSRGAPPAQGTGETRPPRWTHAQLPPPTANSSPAAAGRAGDICWCTPARTSRRAGNTSPGPPGGMPRCGGGARGARHVFGGMCTSSACSSAAPLARPSAGARRAVPLPPSGLAGHGRLGRAAARRRHARHVRAARRGAGPADLPARAVRPRGSGGRIRAPACRRPTRSGWSGDDDAARARHRVDGSSASACTPEAWHIYRVTTRAGARPRIPAGDEGAAHGRRRRRGEHRGLRGGAPDLQVLHGPHVPRFVAAGDLARLPYLVMEYVPGRTLQDWLDAARAAAAAAAHRPPARRSRSPRTACTSRTPCTWTSSPATCWCAPTAARC